MLKSSGMILQFSEELGLPVVVGILPVSKISLPLLSNG
jgi:cell division protein FtsW (lipid II flippase)